jgi:hypothetical protein
MKLPAKIVAWLLPLLLLPLLLTGCFHRSHPQPAQTLAPPVEQVAPPAPAPAPAQATLPAVTAPAPLEPSSPSTTPPPQPTTPRPPVKHRKPVNRNPEEASLANPSVSAIGELSSGDPVSYRVQTRDLIASTEHGLNSITRPLGSSDQKTAEHIRAFLKQAKTALASGDVDGANTLAAKAKVLLGELTR